MPSDSTINSTPVTSKIQISKKIKKLAQMTSLNARLNSIETTLDEKIQVYEIARRKDSLRSLNR